MEKVIAVDGAHVKVKYKEGIKDYKLVVFEKSNSKGCNQPKFLV